ncbi:hypothetical protein [Zooshikella sp. RANM57]|uniref:hypothetical protein n=1 Tax=Zooshikella sp. RANM57 TaxID=3425863 RepID=UPI003D6E22EF
MEIPFMMADVGLSQQLSTRLRQAMIDIEIDVDELATRSGVEVSVIEQLLVEGIPTSESVSRYSDILRKLTHVLLVPMDYLLGVEESPGTLMPDERHFLSVFTCLPKEMRDQARQLIKLLTDAPDHIVEECTERMQSQKYSLSQLVEWLENAVELHKLGCH